MANQYISFTWHTKVQDHRFYAQLNQPYSSREPQVSGPDSGRECLDLFGCFPIGTQQRVNIEKGPLYIGDEESDVYISEYRGDIKRGEWRSQFDTPWSVSVPVSERLSEKRARTDNAV